MIAWLAPAAWASTPEVEALRLEAARATAELRLPEAPGPYHLRYRLQVLDTVEARASFGALVAADSNRLGLLGVETRVGSPAFDNTGFGGWEDGMAAWQLPVELDATGVRRAAWRVTDGAYKQAVEHLARKTAQWTPPPDHAGDYTLTGPILADDGTAPPHDTAALHALAARLSAAFAGGPDVEVGQVWVGAEAGHEWIVDTEGTAVRRPLQEVTVRAAVALRAPDGTRVADERLWTVRAEADLPPVDALVAEIGSLQAGVRRVADAPVLAEEYVGPVVFLGDAALDLFRWLLVPQLEGTPPAVAFETRFGDLGSEAPSARAGRRVLPSGWSATDDATTATRHPAWMLHDAEGTPTRRVEAVLDGVVRDLLMTRVPRPGMASTGHARGYAGSVGHARAAALSVVPPRHGSSRHLHRAAVRAARDVGLDRYLVVRSLWEPALTDVVDGAPPSIGSLPPPVTAAWRGADGHEEPVRGLSFEGVHRLLLRDIVAAGLQNTGSFLAPFAPGASDLGPTEGLATLLSAPDVLVREMELVPLASDPGDPPVLALPSP